MTTSVLVPEIVVEHPSEPDAPATENPNLPKLRMTAEQLCRELAENKKLVLNGRRLLLQGVSAIASALNEVGRDPQEQEDVANHTEPTPAQQPPAPPDTSAGDGSALDIVATLRAQAVEIAIEGHAGWGNTMTAAADEIERLRQMPNARPVRTTDPQRGRGTHEAVVGR